MFSVNVGGDASVVYSQRIRSSCNYLIYLSFLLVHSLFLRHFHTFWRNHKYDDHLARDLLPKAHLCWVLKMIYACMHDIQKMVAFHLAFCKKYCDCYNFLYYLENIYSPWYSLRINFIIFNFLTLIRSRQYALHSLIAR